MLNDYYIRVVKTQGDFTRHSHPETDEVFLVLKGSLSIHLDDEEVVLGPGQLYVVGAPKVGSGLLHVGQHGPGTRLGWRGGGVHDHVVADTVVHLSPARQPLPAIRSGLVVSRATATAESQRTPTHSIDSPSMRPASRRCPAPPSRRISSDHAELGPGHGDDTCIPGRLDGPPRGVDVHGPAGPIGNRGWRPGIDGASPTREGDKAARRSSTPRATHGSSRRSRRLRASDDFTRARSPVQHDHVGQRLGTVASSAAGWPRPARCGWWARDKPP